MQKLDAGVREMTVSRYLQTILVVQDAEAELGGSRVVVAEVRETGGMGGLGGGWGLGPSGRVGSVASSGIRAGP